MEFLIALLGVVILYLLVRLRRQRPQPPAADAAGPAEGTGIYAFASRLYRPYDESAQPADLLGHADFEAGVQLLNSQSTRYTTQDLLAYYRGDNAIVACLALEALARRKEPLDLRDEILSSISTVPAWTRFFALRALEAHAPVEPPVVAALLLQLDSIWMSRMAWPLLRDFVAKRVQLGEKPSFGTALERVDAARADLIQQGIGQLGETLVPGLATEFDHWRRTRVDTTLLASIGRVWGTRPATGEQPTIEHDALIAHVADLEATLTRAAPRSVLLVGESGVGKTAVVKVLAARLQRAGWTIFEASNSELVAGQVYIGQLEERLLNLVRGLGGRRRVLWFIPDFHALQWTGRTTQNQSSALDFLLPCIESGEIQVVGETRPSAYEQLALLKPRCLTALETRRVEPLAETATLDLAREWARRRTAPDRSPLLPEATLREAWSLAQQYLGDQAAPGSLLGFVSQTYRRLTLEDETAPVTLQVDDLIVTLTRLTGLPASILDERHSLDLPALRQLFERRVLGQPEAVDCLVERVAMIKAGVTDPTRPQGVFLFAGPTGTGKTEITKTLAEFLFGAPNRMIRLDMSELQTPESLNRLLGTLEGKTEGALVDAIRKQPFSVVLLDEFEKAHPSVWDLFLQVFDDGRLTDRAGNTADFRHAIIIMTSNLGGVIPSGTALGFGASGRGFRPQDVERVIGQAFRREFLNRIDRVVIFHPLNRETMREILRKELDDVTLRRGLRNRSWAIEWDEGAIEFLLAKGFTADLGARPLRRAIERYFLSPLAMAIVDHRFPAGDQFLFVHAEGDGIEVQFVDPDAETTTPQPEPAAAVPEPAAMPLLAEIAFEPRGTPAEIENLRVHYARLRGCIDDDAWQENKRSLLARMAEPGFWHDPNRFRALGQVEYLDRIEQGLGGAGSLLERLLGSRPGTRERYPNDLVGRLAHQLYLLDAACAAARAGEPVDVFLLVEAGRDPGVNAARANEVAMQLARMYRAWAHRRRMQVQVIEESGGDGKQPYRFLLAVSGFAAYSILRLEAGLHVFESQSETGGSKSCKVRVRIAAQPDEPFAADGDAQRKRAYEALRGTVTDELVVVRRYRESPAPFVRDRVRGGRTSKLDRVLAGDFDLALSGAGT